ncbi:MAG: ABC transporter ATP-binding protein [Chloroflexi bacterium]|nr:ABC transporter ATP-binding protein [Chloroflexota bacterium]
MAEFLLDVRDLHVEFGGYEGLARVIDGVSLYVRRGETVGLVGETGCGKSVTARAVMGLLPGTARITQGEILFKGQNLLDLDPQAMQTQVRGRGISMIFQDPMSSLNPVFTIGEQLSDVIRWQGVSRVGLLHYLRRSLDREERRRIEDRVVEMLDKVRIPTPREMLNRYPVQLSGGMRQRVLIALALINRPELVIADEPGTALDVSIQDQILALIRDLVASEGISVLYITHDLGVARSLCDRIYVMYAGQVAETAPAESLFREQYHPYTRGLLDSIPRLTGRLGEGIEGRIPDYRSPLRGCRFYDRCPRRMPHCQDVRPEPIEMAPEHFVACHLYSDDSAGGAS